MRSRQSLSLGVCCFACVATVATSSFASGNEIPLFLVKPDEVKVDGVLKEWDSGLSRLTFENQGAAGGTSMQGGLAYDDRYLYVAGVVVDRKFVRTPACGPNEDHAELVLTFPEANGEYRTLYEVGLFAGDPGKVAGQVKAAGMPVSGATLIEAPEPNGYTFEAKIPWSLFPPAAKTRAGLRGVLRYYDTQGSGISTVLSSADKGRAEQLPHLPNAAEQSLRSGLLSEKGIVAEPSRDLVANVAADAMNERVLLYDRYLVLLGPHFRDGAEYFWSDLGVDVARGGLPFFELHDLTGDGRAELVVRKKFDRGSGSREMLQVMSFAPNGTPESIFEHEIGISSSAGSIQNTVRIEGTGRGASVVVGLGESSGFSSATYNEPTDTNREPLLLPWGTVQSRTFGWDGKHFKMTSEQAKPAGEPGAAATPAGPPAPPAPRPPTGDELLDQVFALYKKDRNIAANAAPRFDFVTNVAEDDRMERIVCHGRDLVVFGKGFREGRGYVSLNMAQFAQPADIVDVTARDLNGNGLAEILVRGIQTGKAPTELGEGNLTREVFFAYTVYSDKIARIFAAETAVAMPGMRLQSTLAFVASRSGLDLELRPGRAIGWDRQTWPFKQDTDAVSGVEPVVLPWTANPVHYHFDGTAYTR